MVVGQELTFEVAESPPGLCRVRPPEEGCEGRQSLVGTQLLAFPARGAGRLRLPHRQPHAVHGFAAGQPKVYLPSRPILYY